MHVGAEEAVFQGNVLVRERERKSAHMCEACLGLSQENTLSTSVPCHSLAVYLGSHNGERK